MDYYATIISQRSPDEAIQILADDCRKKDKAIAVLREALIHAKDVIKTWHGMEAWLVYEKHSPEMKKINEALGQG